MHNKSSRQREDAKVKKAFKHSDESRNSTTGYLETGNDAQVHGKARVMRNRDNDSYI